MNMTQISYFLAAARMLNFSKAAASLYITQPALSKQITAIERKLNMQLFIRSPDGLRLTPAGSLLLEELPDLQDKYEAIIERAKKTNDGYTSTLAVGTLENQHLSLRFIRGVHRYNKLHPQISVRLLHTSFGGLRELLASDEIDLALTLDIDVKGGEGDDLQTAVFEDCPVYLAVSNTIALPDKEPLTLRDLRDIPFILPEDSPLGSQMILDECRDSGFVPTTHYAPNLSTVMLWIEAGMGIGYINAQSSILNNDTVRIIDEKGGGRDSRTCLLWKKSNPKPSLGEFIRCLQAQ